MKFLTDIFNKGTLIPDNPTNRDVIKAMFPNGIKIDRSTAHAKRVTEDWLNAPYRVENEEK